MSTTVVNYKTDKYDVYIGRPSIWGNPFTHIADRNTLAKFVVRTREEAISKYENYLLNSPGLMAQLHTLKDKRLACWCKPKSCHGDTLATWVDLLY